MLSRNMYINIKNNLEILSAITFFNCLREVSVKEVYTVVIRIKLAYLIEYYKYFVLKYFNTINTIVIMLLNIL